MKKKRILSEDDDKIWGKISEVQKKIRNGMENQLKNEEKNADSKSN